MTFLNQSKDNMEQTQTNEWVSHWDRNDAKLNDIGMADCGKQHEKGRMRLDIEDISTNKRRSSVIKKFTERRDSPSPEAHNVPNYIEDKNKAANNGDNRPRDMGHAETETRD